MKNLFCCIIILLSSCTGRNKYPGSIPESTSEQIISHAKRLKIEKSDGYSVVYVLDPWQGVSGIVQKWYLVARGQKVHAGIDSSQVIYVPVRKIICMSTTHLAMISSLDEKETVTGFSGIDFIYDPVFKRMAGEGYLHEVGYEDNLNKELILSLAPDLIMVYGIGNESAGYMGKLKELGIKVMFNADYLEAEPLAKSEWIKLFGALYCKEVQADSIFRSTVNQYTGIKSFIDENAAGKPNVLLGLPFKDTWYISPGNSYISKLISDAGGNYLWKDTESSVAMPLGLEDVYLKAMSADFWLNTSTVNTLQEIISIDPRFGDLSCFKHGDLYNNNKRSGPGGGNDYWESGCLNPQVILRDIGSILHPELFPERQLYYYKKLSLK